MKRALFLAGALALVVGVAWFAWPGGEGVGPGPRPVGGPGAGPERLDDAPSLVGDGPRDPEGSGEAVADGAGGVRGTVSDAAANGVEGAADPPSGPTVRVVGGSGDPREGWDVVLFRGTRREVPAATVTTDADGRATFDVDLSGTTSELAVMVRGALPVGEDLPWQAIFRSDRVPEDDLVLVVPDSGRLRVRLVGPDGEPWLRPMEGILGDGESPVPVRSQPARASGVSDTGVLEFGPVALGRTLRVSLATELGAPVERDLSGPTRPGETVERTVELLGDKALVRMRVLDATGALLHDAEVRVRARQGQHRDRVGSSGVSHRTDGAGRLAVLLDPSDRNPWHDALGLWHDPDPTDPDPGHELQATIRLPDPMGAGGTDVGDVRLDVRPPDPPMLRGRVTDAQGRPVGRASVRLYLPLDRRHERMDSTPMGTCGDQGEFELHGTWPGGVLDLVVNGRERGRARVPVHEGDTVEVVLEAPGRVEGWIQVGPGVSAHKLRVELDPEGEDDGLRASTNQLVEPDGTFRFEGLVPGTYVLGLRVEGSARELERVPSVRVVSGEVVEDPRLQGIDLRGRLRTQRVTVRVPEGGEGPDGHVLVLPEDRFGPRFWDGEVEVLVPPGPVDLVLQPEGYAEVVLRGLTADHEVLLPRRLDAVLRLVLDGPIPESPATLHPVLRGGGATAWTAEEALTRTQEFQVRGVAPGEYQLRWEVRRVSGAEGNVSTRGSGSGHRVVLRPDEDGQVLEVHVSVDELAPKLDAR